MPSEIQIKSAPINEMQDHLTIGDLFNRDLGTQELRRACVNDINTGLQAISNVQQIFKAHKDKIQAKLIRESPLSSTLAKLEWTSILLVSLRGWSIRPQTALDFKLLIFKLDLLMKFLRKFKQDLHSFFGDDVEIGGPKLKRKTGMKHSLNEIAKKIVHSLGGMSRKEKMLMKEFAALAEALQGFNDELSDFMAR
ncbi:hypothetical protein P389DRAFT_210007 [Cystobasidium minutum MCA 4210]|uniref:uncharacterized protein n=1 Tax=Cystobasidium minutum MCA 4210 TaxID=1397322 RepID=UPI0034CDD8A1|eukprot:jgi/Rhomi1/210007/estExt_Genemark1.C_3_t20199